MAKINPGKTTPQPSRNSGANNTGGVENTSDESASTEEESVAGNLTSPEGVFLIIFAVIFDLVGLIPIINIISDIIAAIFFGFWAIITGRKGVLKKFILSFLLEFVPIVSDAAPFISIGGMFVGKKLPTSWIGFVYSTLMGGSGAKKINPSGE